MRRRRPAGATVTASVLALALASTAMTSWAQVATDPNPAREEDEEPNQQSDIEPVGAEEERATDFFGDAELVLKPRTYYLDRDRDIPPDSVAWALGGSLEFRTGWWADRLRLGATLFTSQKLYGPDDKDGTLLLKPGQEGFTVLGEAYATLRFVGAHGMRVGRQSFDMPYLGRHDIRMVPNTFEAVAFGNRPGDGLAYLAGYVDAIKRKNDDDFIPMSEAAGATGSDEGVGFAGARYRLPDGSTFGAVYQHTFDTFGTFFAKAEKQFDLGEDLALWTDLSWTDQRSVGDELIGDFSTHLLSAKLELVSGVNRFRLAASTTDDDFGIQKPYGNPANYLSIIVNDFDRAGEDAVMVGFSRDMGELGPGTISMFGNVAHGDTPDAGPVASPDQTEYDVTVDWRVKEGWGDRLWFRFRGAWIDQDEAVEGANDYYDFRIIVNWDLGML
jgi:hypothetical protein